MPDPNFGIRLSADPTALVTGVQTGEAALRRLKQEVAGAGDTFRHAGGGVAALKAELEGMSRSMADLGKFGQLATGLFGITAAAAPAVAGLKAVFDAGLQLDRLRQTFTAISGSSALAGAEIAYVSEVAGRLGIDLISATNAYAKLAASARGTALEGRQTKEVFEAVANASARLGLTAAETDGALLAISQMMSKGTIQAEELRGQLSERLPGAFARFAEGLGVSTAELGKMLERGEVLAADALPKFAAALNKAYAGEEMRTAQAEINRLSGEWEKFKREVADSGIGDLATKALRELAAAVRGGTNVVKEWRTLGEQSGKSYFEGLAATFGKSAILLESLPGMKDVFSVKNEIPIKIAAYLLRRQQANANKLVQDGSSQFAPPTDEAANAAALANSDAIIRAMEEAARPAQAYLDVIGKSSGVTKEFTASLKALHDEFIRQGGADTPGNVERYRAEVEKIIKDADYAKDFAAAAKRSADEALAVMKAHYEGRVALAKAAAESERAANKAAVASGLMTESEAATKDMAAALQAVSAEYDATAEMLTKLSPKSREYAALMEKLRVVAEQYSQAQSKGAAAVADAKTKETKALQAWHEEARRSNVAYEKHVEAVEADAKAAELDVLQMGLSQFALAALTATRIEAVISQKEATLAAAEYAAVTDGETIPAIRREIEALKKKRDAVMAGGIKAAAADEQQLARDNFNQIADIMVGAFERGFSHVKNLGRELKNALSQIFSQFVIRPLLQAGVGLVGSMAQGAVNGIVGGGTSNLFGSVAGNAAQSVIGNYASSYLFGNAGAAFTAAMTPAATTAAMGSPALAASMYGGSAAEIVGGAALAADGTATGAGILAGMEAGLAAIPVAGWVALAALVIYGIVSGMEEGAAERTGVFANAAGSKGGNPLFASSSAFGSFGVVQDQWLSNDSGFVAAMTDILNSVKSVDNAVAAIIGKDNTALVSAALASQTTSVSFGMEDANLDSVRGMSASQILVARYKVVLNTLDEGLGDVLDNFKGSGADLATMITSLVSFSQATKKFPKDIHDNLIKALDGTADSLRKVMKFANAFSVYQTLAGQDRNELVNTAILAQQAPGNFQFSSILAAVGTMADEFDGSADSAAALAAGLQDLQAASVNLIASFVAAKNDLHDLFTGTIRDIRLDLLQTPGEKIDFLRAENTSLIAQIATATSPEQIRSLGGRINQNYTTAWSLLTPEQRAAQGNDYIANLSATDTLVADRIDDITTNIGDATDAMITKVGNLLTGAITALGAAADVIKAAAADIKTGGEAILEAANTPLVVQVEDPPLVNSP